MAETKVVIKKNFGVVNVGKVEAKKTRKSDKQRAEERRKQATAKLDERKHLGPTAPEDTVPKPPDLNLQNLTHLSHNCIANHLVSAAWSQVPMLRFDRRARKDADGRTFRDTIRFNDWALRRLGLAIKMNVAIFVDRVVEPKYLIIQNVVRKWEAPAHLHRLGTFKIRSERGSSVDHNHLCKPETFTELGVIGHKTYKPHPLALFEHLPNMEQHQLRLYRVAGQPDLIIGFMTDLEPVPERLADKLTRIGVPLLESVDRPYDPSTDVATTVPDGLIRRRRTGRRSPRTLPS
jgi:hypothetical protein